MRRVFNEKTVRLIGNERKKREPELEIFEVQLGSLVYFTSILLSNLSFN